VSFGDFENWILWLLPDIDPNLVMAVVAAATGIIAVIQTFRANKLNKQVVQAQGALSGPRLSVALFDDESITLFMVAAPLSANRALEFPLWYVFKNDGRTARDVEISVTSSSALYYGGRLPASRRLTSNARALLNPLPRSRLRAQNILRLNCTRLAPSSVALDRMLGTFVPGLSRLQDEVASPTGFEPVF